MEQRFTLRFASAADAEAIDAVLTAVWRTTYRGIVRDETLDALDRAGWASAWAAAFRPEDGHFALLAEGERRAIGFLLAGPTREGFTDYPGEIYALYVLAGHQGRGMGRALLIQAVRAFEERGLVPIHLNVIAENARSLDFYRRAGGVPLYRDKSFVLDGVTLTDHAIGFPRPPFEKDRTVV